MEKYVSPTRLSVLTLGIILSACSSYRQNIMFKVPEGYRVQQEIVRAEKNYVIQKSDYLEVEVYTNDGERIIDPDLRLIESLPTQALTTKPTVQYLVNTQGLVKLPMVGDVNVEGLTIRELEALLQSEYEKFYHKPFVVIRYLNKRVVVLGAPGGQVIPLTNENIRLVEILALAKGIDNTAKANNIRVMRGDQVFVADFSTLEGYQKGNMIMEPDDVIYVEPVRRVVSEAARDYGPLVSVLVSLVTLIVVIQNIN